MSNNVRRWIAEGYGATTPRFLGEVPALFRDGTWPVDVVLLNCSMPDEEGYVSFGVSADLATAATECAKTVIAQPAIMATSLTAFEILKREGIEFSATAGHSLGEYAAMVAAGILSFEDGFRVIKARAEAMQALLYGDG